MTINEKNETIVKWMGHKACDCASCKRKTEIDGDVRYNMGEYIWNVVSVSKLTYHECWDELMPVVDRIYETADDDTKEINSEGHAIFELGIASDITTVHEACFKYIVWDNEQKKQ